MSRSIDYSQLPTEQDNPASRRIDRVSIRSALSILNRQDSSVAPAVRRALPSIEKAVELIVRALIFNHKLFFFGAGTSGRLGVLEAAECPPTFNTPPKMVQAFMAGGRSSVFRSKEGAEDRFGEAIGLVRRHVSSGDVVVGIAASGVTPYVRAALTEAAKKGAKTILLTCNPRPPKLKIDCLIAVNTGPETISGSTRLKAGTATKLVLNSLTVASMIRLGKVYGNKMVDLQPRSKKLVERAVRLISELGRVPAPKARLLLKAAGGNAKTAILMARLKLSRDEAQKKLGNTSGKLWEALQ